MKKIFLMLSLAILSTAFLAAADGNVEDRSRVCMMQDMLMLQEGIPLKHEGKTYYGCCEMCKDRIAQEPERYTKAVDPISGKTVDKADAFLYAHQGTVFYFESKETRAKFAKDPARHRR
jgi:YHS domain-containing protein